MKITAGLKSVGFCAGFCSGDCKVSPARLLAPAARSSFDSESRPFSQLYFCIGAHPCNYQQQSVPSAGSLAPRDSRSS